MNRTAHGLRLDPKVAHNASHAAFLGRACELAYLSDQEGTTEYLKQLDLHASLISSNNTQVYLGGNEEAIVLAFRGSESLFTLDGFKDWLLTNARNFLVLPEGRIGTDFAAAGVGARFHSGFLSALNDIWDQLFPRVDQEFSRKERPVWITGHSLGGALALLSGWRLQRNFIPIHQICTFGAPMIGNDAAAAAFHKEFPDRIYRYVDSGDLVPRLPTVSLFSNSYQHCNHEIVVGDPVAPTAPVMLEQFTESAETEAENGIEELPQTVADSLWDELRKGMPSHMMGNYLSRLNQQA
jgi:triacylglycerol lipase